MEKASLIISYQLSVISERIKKNKLEFLVLFVIIAIGSFLRFYRISEYMTFLGDEGRDAIVVRRLLVDFDPILVGPGTSIGNMYLGPLYYYMMAPALRLANFSPVGPAVMVALLGVVTVAFVWFVGREWFGPAAAGFAATLYAIAPTVIIYSRSSWNPNIMPFFALLAVYATWRVWQKQQFKWLIVTGVSLAFVLNSHYLGLLLVPLLGLFWLLIVYRLRVTGYGLKKLLFYSLFSLFLFLLLMSPLFIFDARHGWRNFEAIKTFFMARQTTVSARPWNALPEAWPLTQKIATRLIAARNEFFGSFVALFMIASLAWLTGVYKTKLVTKEKPAYVLVLAWIGFALLGLGLYKQEIYDHYFGFFFPAPFLLVGAILDHAIERAKIRGWWLALTAMTFLVFINLVNSPISIPPNRQLQRTEEVAEKIKKESEERKFNLAVIAERNYEDAYQYFLEKWGTRVSDIDPLRYEETVAGELYVVCELPKEKCDPTHNPKAEVANFGWSQIASEWNVGGITVYKLTHSQ